MTVTSTVHQTECIGNKIPVVIDGKIIEDTRPWLSAKKIGSSPPEAEQIDAKLKKKPSYHTIITSSSEIQPRSRTVEANE